CSKNSRRLPSSSTKSTKSFIFPKVQAVFCNSPEVNLQQICCASFIPCSALNWAQHFSAPHNAAKTCAFPACLMTKQVKENTLTWLFAPCRMPEEPGAA